MTAKEIEQVRVAVLSGVNLTFDHYRESQRTSNEFELKKLELMNANLAEQTKLSRSMAEREYAQILHDEKDNGEVV